MRSFLLSILLASLAATLASAGSVEAELKCSPTIKESIGAIDSFPFNADAIDIVKQDGNSVSFLVSQEWVDPGTPMMAVGYRSLDDSEEVCDMDAHDDGSLIAYGESKSFTAECHHGFAEIGIYLYVGDNDDFSAEECEACKAPDDNYVGHYVILPCEYRPECDPETPEEASLDDCAGAGKIQKIDELGDVDAFVDFEVPITITSQRVEEVIVQIAQVFDENGVAMIGVEYLDPVTEETTCDDKRPFVPYEDTLTIEAKCDKGYAEFSIFVFTDDVDELGECESCSIGGGDQVVQFVYLVPCLPLCKPEVPDCLDGPLVTLADIGEEIDVCIFEESPIMVDFDAMTSGNVAFHIENTWPGYDVTSASISYPGKDGDIVCETFPDSGQFDNTGELLANCNGGVATIVVSVHSEMIDYNANQIESACTNPPDVGTCSYEFIVPCDPDKLCAGADPTDEPTGFPTQQPSGLIITDDPTGIPTDAPSVSPSDHPTFNPTKPPTMSPTADPTFNPTANPTANPTGSPTTKAPTGSPTSNPSESMAPTDCTEPKEPQIISQLCKLGEDGTDMIALPPGSVLVDGNGDSVTIQVTQSWDDISALAIKYSDGDLESSCDIETEVGSGVTYDLASQCTHGYTSATVIVFYGAFEETECEACDVEEIEELGGNFCAYNLLIDCAPMPVDCGEPSASPSGSYYPSSAPSESPTIATPSPTLNPTADPTATPTAGPTATPTANPTAGPTATPTANPTAGPTATPTNNPTGGPTAKPTANPTAKPTANPTGGPTTNPTANPTGGPTANPTANPTAGPTANPTANPTGNPTANPTGSPTTNPSASMAPTNCVESMPPKVISRVCMDGDDSMDMIDFPDDAVLVTGGFDDTAGITITSTWDEITALAVKYNNVDLDATCEVKEDVTSGSIYGLTTACTHGVTSATVIVYYNEFTFGECNACDVEEISKAGGKFCAYNLEIDCEPKEVDCGEPSASPSGSFYPSSAPTETPTIATPSPTLNPTANPTAGPTSNPTANPTANPTSNPTADPTLNPTANPTFGPTSNPTSNPTAGPTANPTANPTAGPTANPTAGPTSNPTFNPTAGPTANPTANPTAGPTANPTANPTAGPTADPTFNPTAGPTATPTANPTAGPTANPTANPTAGPTVSPTANPTVSAAPTNCVGEMPPKLVSQVCQENGIEMDMIDIPEGAVLITGGFDGTAGISITTSWDDISALAIKYMDDDLSNTCDIETSVEDSYELNAGCVEGVTSATVIVYYGEFVEDDCDACDVEEISKIGGKFCAYNLEIDCEPKEVDCGEPSASPSGSFYPSSAPSEAPSMPSDEPTGSPTSTPTSNPTFNPTAGPTANPTANPTAGPTANPTAGPTATPTANPTAGPTSNPTFNPTAGPTANPTANPTAGPTSNPTANPTAGPTTNPTANPTAGPTANPTAGPTSNPTFNPTAGPTANPTANPTAGPTASPTANPTAGPTATPTANPTAGPTANPTANPTATPTASPTANPTVSAAPTDCVGNTPPKIISEICKDGVKDLNMTDLPDDAIIINGKFDGSGVDVSINQDWSDDIVAVAIKHLNEELDDSCDINTGVSLESSYDFSAQCIDGFTSATVVVYFGSYDEEDCKACDVEDISQSGGHFCAYNVEIDCKPMSVDCGEPSASPSGSFYPSSAPSEAPSMPSDEPTGSPTSTPTANPTFNPTAGPTANPTSNPTAGPTANPTANPTAGPTANPTAGPTANPTANPTAGPTSNPTFNPTAGPTANPTANPTAGPTAGPTANPTSNPTADPTKSPTDGPTAGPTHFPTTQPSSGPSLVPTDGPTAGPTHFPTTSPTASMAPTRCSKPMPPEVVEKVCKTTGGDVMETTPLPPGTITIGDMIDGKIEFTVSQFWKDITGLAIKVGQDSCDIKEDVPLGGVQEVEATCTEGYASLTVVVYLDEDFDMDECEACTVDDIAALDGNSAFCAYRIEIPCDVEEVDCGEPSAAPSGSFYPSSDPTGSPTISMSPTRAPTDGPTTPPTGFPTTQPSSGPTDGPTTPPTGFPTTQPSSGPTGTPSTASPTFCPESEPKLVNTEGETDLPPGTINIVARNGTHLEFEVVNMFNSTVSSIFTQYHSGSFGETECLEESNVDQEESTPVFVAQCMRHTNMSITTIWVTDCEVGETSFLNGADNAEIPECCHADEECKTVQYTFKIPCEPCPTDEEPEPVRKLQNVRNLHAGDLIKEKKANEGSTAEFEALTGRPEDTGSDDHFCVVEDYPCGTFHDKVHVCHYSARDGYKTFCVPEPDSDALRFYPKDYCGPCVGGYAAA